MAEEANSDIKGMSFEQALEALEKIVEDLERGDVPLDQSIRIYERGEALKKHCDQLLKSAEDKVEKSACRVKARPPAASRSTRAEPEIIPGPATSVHLFVRRLFCILGSKIRFR